MKKDLQVLVPLRLDKTIFKFFSITGYPPADDNVRNYLTGVISRKDAYNRSCAFLEALFTQTNAVLQDIHSKNHNEMITQFRDFMNKDQKMSGHNNNRKNFFSEVIQKAMKLQKSVCCVQLGVDQYL